MWLTCKFYFILIHVLVTYIHGLDADATSLPKNSFNSLNLACGSLLAEFYGHDLLRTNIMKTKANKSSQA